LKDIFKILNQYILPASVVALCSIHALLSLWCLPRIKLELASAEVLIWLAISEGGREWQ
jgi:hypothetical protein